MLEYFIGAIFMIAFCFYLYMIGTIVINETEKYSYKLVIGYLIYSFFVAVFGLVVQIFSLPWKIFAIYMIILILFSTILCIYRIKKYKIQVLPHKLKKFIYNYWFLILLTLFLMILTIFHINAYWFNNHLDDGYYINKMVMLPHIENAFKVTPGTGFIRMASFNSYTLNTHELEMSFYLSLLPITPTLFIRFFMAGFHYFLMINCIYAFAEKIIVNTNIKVKKEFLQYIPSIVLLFAFNEMFLKNKGILFLQDSNQFCNAMYYGSSVVRTMGILMLVLPFIGENKITLKMILKVMAISTVLISKSSIALPIIIATVIAFSIVTMIFDKRINNIVLFVIFVIIVGINIFLNDNNHVNSISQYAFQNVCKNIYQLGFVFGVIMIIVSCFIKKEIIIRINLFLLVFFVILGLPFMNNLLSLLSFYAFVIGRAFTCFCYTMLVVATIYIFLFLNIVPLSQYIRYGIVYASIVCLGVGNVYSVSAAGGSLFYEDKLTSLNLCEVFNVWKNNNKFIPYSSLELGNILKRLSSEKNEDVNVICRELHNVNGRAYALATSLTSVAPNVKSVSAKFRYGEMEEDNPFSGYTIEDQKIFELFMFQFDEEVYLKFKEILDKYPINCIILVVDDKEKYMNELGFKLYDKVISLDAGVIYYVYEK